MRRLRAIVPPFGVEEDVIWVEEEVSDDQRRGGIATDSDAVVDDANAATSSFSTSKLSADKKEDDADEKEDDADKKEDDADEVLIPGVRRSLPQAPPPGNKPSMFAVVKKIASTPGGAQLMDIQLPLKLCEPMSELQRRAEILVPGVRCLDEAARCPPLSLDRILHVAAYAASTYACTVRTTKCVSPVLGETIDAVIPRLGVRMLAEFVACDRKGGYMSSAWVMRGGRGGWSARGDDAPHASLRPSGLETHAGFRSRLVFDDGDVYDWARATPIAVGLASGKNAIAYDGRVRIAPVLASCSGMSQEDPDGADDGTRDGADDDADALPLRSSKKYSPCPSDQPPSHVLHAVLDFKGTTLMAALKGGSAVSRKYSGWVERVPATQTRETTPRSRERVPGVELEGDFGSHLDAVVVTSTPTACGATESSTRRRSRLWSTPEAVPGCRYGYTKFSAGLNDDQRAKDDDSPFPPTDSRMRRDTRLLESGEYDEAQSHLERFLASDRARSAAALEEALAGDGKLKAVWFEELGGGIRRRAAAAAAEPSATGAAATAPAPLASSAAVSAFIIADAEPNSHNEFRRSPLRWRFKGDYWRARKVGDWSRCPRIFE